MTCGSNPGECTKFYLDIAITLLCLNFSHSTILYHTLWYIPKITVSINNTKMDLSIKYIFCSTISHNNQFLRNQKWYYKRTPCIPLYLHLGPTPVNFCCNEFPAFFGNTGNYVIAFLNIWLEVGLIEPLKNVTLFETIAHICSVAFMYIYKSHLWLSWFLFLYYNLHAKYANTSSGYK